MVWRTLYNRARDKALSDKKPKSYSPENGTLVEGFNLDSVCSHDNPEVMEEIAGKIMEHYLPSKEAAAEKEVMEVEAE